jgi:hypothetical protein
MSLWDRWKSLLSRGSPSAPSARRLDGRSRTLLAASIKALPYETPGWITNKEAKQLFSSMDDEYAFGEMDEVGKGNIADFAAHVTPRCSFEFMPVIVKHNPGRIWGFRCNSRTSIALKFSQMSCSGYRPLKDIFPLRGRRRSW